VGPLTVSPERIPSARRLVSLRERIDQLDVCCVFREPQFQSSLVETLVEDTGARIGILDPMGAPGDAGEDAYFRLMERNTDSLVACLQQC
jgi:zinc transport system substrate-binding protein